MLDSKTDFKINIYLPIIDKINVELKKTFSNNENLLLGISALHPKNNNFLNAEFIQPFALAYR